MTHHASPSTPKARLDSPRVPYTEVERVVRERQLPYRTPMLTFEIRAHLQRSWQPVCY